MMRQRMLSCVLLCLAVVLLHPASKAQAAFVETFEPNPFKNTTNFLPGLWMQVGKFVKDGKAFAGEDKGMAMLLDSDDYWAETSTLPWDGSSREVVFDVIRYNVPPNTNCIVRLYNSTDGEHWSLHWSDTLANLPWKIWKTIRTPLNVSPGVQGSFALRFQYVHSCYGLGGCCDGVRVNNLALPFKTPAAAAAVLKARGGSTDVSTTSAAADNAPSGDSPLAGGPAKPTTPANEEPQATPAPNAHLDTPNSGRNTPSSTLRGQTVASAVPPAKQANTGSVKPTDLAVDAINAIAPGTGSSSVASALPGPASNGAASPAPGKDVATPSASVAVLNTATLASPSPAPRAGPAPSPAPSSKPRPIHSPPPSPARSPAPNPQGSFESNPAPSPAPSLTRSPTPSPAPRPAPSTAVTDPLNTGAGPLGNVSTARLAPNSAAAAPAANEAPSTAADNAADAATASNTAADAAVTVALSDNLPGNTGGWQQATNQALSKLCGKADFASLSTDPQSCKLWGEAEATRYGININPAAGTAGSSSSPHFAMPLGAGSLPRNISSRGGTTRGLVLVSPACGGSRVVARAVFKSTRQPVPSSRAAGIRLLPFTSEGLIQASPVVRCRLVLDESSAKPGVPEVQRALASREERCVLCDEAHGCPSVQGAWFSDALTFDVPGCRQAPGSGLPYPVYLQVVLSAGWEALLAKLEVCRSFGCFDPDYEAQKLANAGMCSAQAC